ncbi:MAG: hypothetical protein Q9191_004102 [Dirinaria sp. TL-2023a]
MAADTLARYGASVRIIDKNPQPVQVGHAGGLQPRTVEILRSLGLRSTFEGLGNHLCESAFYSREKGGSLERTDVDPEVINASPNPYVLVVHQGNTERVFISDLTIRGVTIDRPVRFIDFKDGRDQEYPLAAHLKDLNTGMIEEVPTKYILGCDGAGSNVRGALHIVSDIQDSTDSWAVADTRVSTDFPDVRRRCNIRTDEANVMLIPHAHGIRIYTLLSQQDVSALEGSKYGGKGYTEENEETVIGVLSRRVKTALRPYKIDIESVEWVSMYHIAQRVSKTFTGSDGRVFILGDACHTHSPKAAQGMNVSMGDAYNLTWKLALQLRGLATPGLLETYEIERQHIAKQLIEFDHNVASMFASSDNLLSKEFHDLYCKNKGFTSGLGYRYPENILVKQQAGIDIDQEALEPLTPGKRLYPIALIKDVSGDRINLVDELPSKGRFHIFVFAGKGGLQSDQFIQAARFLSSPPSPLSTYNKPSTPSGRRNDILNEPSDDRNIVVDLYLIHMDDHLKVKLADLPDPFSKWQSTLYEDVDGKGHAELGLGGQAAVVVVRPDGYVGLVTSLKSIHDTASYFDAFLQKP